MDRQERAELAVRVVGVAVLVNAAGWLVQFVQWVIIWARADSSHGAATMLGELGWEVSAALVGAALMAWPARVARLLIPRPSEGEDSAPAELLRLGMFALAVWFLLGSLLSAVMGASGRPLCFVTAGVGGLLAGAFLARPRPLTRWLGAQTRAGEGWSLAGALGMGLALIALYEVGSHLRVLSSLPDTLTAVAGSQGWSAAHAHAVLTQGCVSFGFGVAAAILLLALCGWLGRRLAPGAQESARPIRGALGRGNWVELAFLAAALYALVYNLQSGIGLHRVMAGAAEWLHVRSAGPAVFLLLDAAELACVAAIAIGLLIIAARLGAALARAFYPVLAEMYDLAPEDAAYLQQHDEPTDRHSLTIAVEVAITVVAVHYLAVSAAYGSLGSYDGRAVLLTVGLLMVLRGDVARWCVRPGEATEDAGQRRRAALYPWLVLLGAVLVVRSAPYLVLRGLVWKGLVPEEPLFGGGIHFKQFFGAPLWAQLGVGLLLMVAGRQVAWLLGYGPLLHGRGGIGHGLRSD